MSLLAFTSSCTKFSWRLARYFFENAIELRKRLKAHSKRDLADAKIAILQKPTRFFNSHAPHIVDKIDAGYLFELFAQMIPTDARCFANFAQRKLFVRMLVDEFSCAPNIHGLGSVTFSHCHSCEMLCGCHILLPLSSNCGVSGRALRPLAIAPLILLSRIARIE